MAAQGRHTGYTPLQAGGAGTHPLADMEDMGLKVQVNVPVPFLGLHVIEENRMAQVQSEEQNQKKQKEEASLHS